MKNIKCTHSDVIYNKVRGLPRKFCNTLYTTVKTNTTCLQFFLWLISNVPPAIAELRCVFWVPRSLNGYQQTVRKEVCPGFLPSYENDGEVSCHGQSLSEKRSTILNRRQKITVNGSLRLNPSARGVKATVLGRRDAQGVILVHMPRSQTINSDLYIPTLKILQKCFRRVGRDATHHTAQILLLQMSTSL